MYQTFRTALLVLFTLTILTGVIYPAIVTVVAQAVFPHQANGSLIQGDGQKRGSTLIGQSFTRPDYFWSRVSATSPVPYNAAASGGSNFGPMHPGLMEIAEARVAALKAGGPTDRLVPIDLATSSASGLDPHISPAAADFQIVRVAAARAISEDVLRELVLQHTEGRTLGLLGEPRVNVVLLNLALDQMPQGQEK